MPQPRLRSRLLLPSLLIFAAACDFPTETPAWDTTWVLPGDTVSLSVSSFFPSGVSTTPEGSAFQLSLSGVTITRSLGEMCGALCQAANGAVVPKPAFSTTLTSSVPLPTDVVAVRLSGGRIDLRLSHDFSFDPIRPSPSARGFIVVTARQGGTTLARDSISGVNTAFPPNTTLSRVLTLSPGTIEGPIEVSVAVSSPAGDPIRIDTNQRLTVQVTPSEVRASEAKVRVGQSRTITGAEVEMGLGEIDSGLADRVRGGALRLKVENPLQVTGTLRLAFRTPGPTIIKAIQVGTGTTETRVEFTREEIRTLIEQPEVVLTPSGTFSVPGGLLTVSPSQTLRVRSELELTVGTGS